MNNNSKKYWEDRMDNAIKKAPTSKVKKLYRQAYTNIDKRLTDLWLELSQMDEISLANLYRCNRYRDLQNAIQDELQILGGNQVDITQAALIDTYIQGWNATNNFIGVSAEWTILNKQFAEQVVKQNYKGATFSDRVWNDMSKLRGQIENTITNTVVTGQDVRKASKELRNRINCGYSDAKRITITETSRVFNESCRETAMSNGYSTYHILSESDCCDDCKELDGATFDIGESVLPVHPHCKCTMIIDLP